MNQLLLSCLCSSPSSSSDETEISEISEIVSAFQANNSLLFEFLQLQQQQHQEEQYTDSVSDSEEESEPESTLYEVPISININTRMDFSSSDVSLWKKSLSSYQTHLESLKNKPQLIELDNFYREELPLLIRERNPNPHMTRSELSKLMQWKLTRGKWRPRLLDFVSSLDESAVKSASQKAFKSLPDVSKAVSELTVLKGVGPATASAVLAAYAPDVAPFMSDEAMVAALGNSKDYTLKQYLVFTEKLQSKAKELSTEGELFTPSDIEMALWSSAVGAKLLRLPSEPDSKLNSGRSSSKRKRKTSS